MLDLRGGEHLPHLRPDRRPPDKHWLPRQRRGVTPQMIGRYPDYDVLDAADTWDAATLGLLGPPQLTPFGDNIPNKVSSVANCQSLNTVDPTRDCVTWGSNR